MYLRGGALPRELGGAHFVLYVFRVRFGVERWRTRLLCVMARWREWPAKDTVCCDVRLLFLPRDGVVYFCWTDSNHPWSRDMITWTCCSACPVPEMNADDEFHVCFSASHFLATTVNHILLHPRLFHPECCNEDVAPTYLQ